MKCLGIAIKKGEVCFSVIEGERRDTATILDTGKQNYRSESATLMMDFSNIFLELLTKYKPDLVSYKLSLDLKMQQIPYMHYSLGVLNLVCLQQGVRIVEHSSLWITAKKQARIMEFQEKFPNAKIKNEELAASVLAWNGLEE